MKIELTKEEAQNVVVALITLSKASDVPVNAMKALINLSDKFVWTEPVKEVKEEVKEEGKK